MKRINNYIFEKLKINKYTKIEADQKLLKQYNDLTENFAKEIVEYFDDKLGDNLPLKFAVAFFYASVYGFDDTYNDPTKIWIEDKSSINYYECYYGDILRRKYLGETEKTISKEVLEKLGWLKKL